MIWIYRLNRCIISRKLTKRCNRYNGHWRALAIRLVKIVLHPLNALLETYIPRRKLDQRSDAYRGLYI